MSIFDILVLICLTICVITGLRKGFISQLAALISVIAGVWLAIVLSDKLALLFCEWFNASAGLMKVIAFTTIFILIVVALGVVAWVLEKVIKLVMLGWLNKLLGVVFSLLFCIILLCVGVAIFDGLNNSFNFVSAEKLSNSIFYGPLQSIYSTIFPHLSNLFK